MTYKQGDNGMMVKRIQKIVGCAADGLWGSVTTECVKKWQKAHGLTPDGIVGAKTLAAMGLSAVVQSMTPSEVEIIQHQQVTLKKSKRRIDLIVVHCTATREGLDMTVDQIRKAHKAQGWSDIGYHYVVDLKGNVHLGRDVDIAGAHASGYNAHSIGVVYVGGLENAPNKNYANLEPKDTRTDSQKATLLSLLMDLRRLYPDAKILGHRDLSPDKNGNGSIEPSEWIKQCPCFDAKLAYRNV